MKRSLIRARARRRCAATAIRRPPRRRRPPIALRPGRPRRADPRARPPRRRAAPPARDPVPGARSSSRSLAVLWIVLTTSGPRLVAELLDSGRHLGAARPPGPLPRLAPPRRRVQPVRPGPAAPRPPRRPPDRARSCSSSSSPQAYGGYATETARETADEVFVEPAAGRRRPVVQRPNRTPRTSTTRAAAAERPSAARLGVARRPSPTVPAGHRPDRRASTRGSAGTRT